MKSTLLSLLLLADIMAYTQPDMYSFFYGDIGDDEGQYGSVDITSGAFTPIATFIDVYVYYGNSTVDEESQEYIFLSTNDAGENKLYTLDLLTGSVKKNPLVTGNLREIQHSCKQDKIFGTSSIDGHARVVSVNSETGELTTLEEYPDVQYFNLYTSSLDQDHDYFFCIGLDMDDDYNFYVIDLADGSIINSTSADGGHPDWVYDCITSKFYSLYGDGVFTVSSLDPLTGDITIINSFPEIDAKLAGTTALVPDENLMIVTGEDADYDLFLYVINFVTGEMEAFFPLDDYLSNLEGIGCCGAVDAIAETDIPSAQIKLFPNPATDMLEIALPDGTNQQSVITITNTAGETVHQYIISQTRLVNLNIEDLVPGLYYASVTQNGKSVSSVFFKQ
ncbi:MAG: T9SS type A sorting domain-containing protein [Fimbriimonadaceae bacterium]|nr:T9SS type A sorting domain-containing protein [Chitinophagales bacterium]